MRVFAALALAAATTVACGGGLFRQYEYEEEMYLSLDGTATVYVNSSMAALDALRDAAFDTRPQAQVDQTALRAYFSTPVTHVTRISTSRRGGRRFVHVRLDVDDVRQLADAAPFKWSSYQFARDGNLFVYRQTIGASGRGELSAAGLTGRELVAFRLHLPSRIVYHNAGPDNPRRGNILAWEQALDDRLRGTPLTLEARMETQSILYRTLWLFGATILAVALLFGLVIWGIVRRAEPETAG